jgi:hypothetical protein
VSDSVLLAVVPVLSAVAGASLAWAANSINERTKWRRDQLARWDERRLSALVDYASAVKREVYLCLRLAASYGLGTMDVASLDKESGLAQLEAAEERRSDLFEAVLLLADARTTEAARHWQAAVWDLHETVNGKRTVDQPTFMSLFRAAGVARDEFHLAARASLSVYTDFARSDEYKGQGQSLDAM